MRKARATSFLAKCRTSEGGARRRVARAAPPRRLISLSSLSRPPTALRAAQSRCTACENALGTCLDAPTPRTTARRPSTAAHRRANLRDVRLATRRTSRVRASSRARCLCAAVLGAALQRQRPTRSPLQRRRPVSVVDVRLDQLGARRRGPPPAALLDPARHGIRRHHLHAPRRAPAPLPAARPHLARRPRLLDRLQPLRPAPRPSSSPTSSHPHLALRCHGQRLVVLRARRRPAWAEAPPRPRHAAERRLGPSPAAEHRSSASIARRRPRGRRPGTRDRRARRRQEPGPRARLERRRERVGDGGGGGLGRCVEGERVGARCSCRSAHDREELQELSGPQGQVRPPVAEVQPVPRPRRRVRLWRFRSRCVTVLLVVLDPEVRD